MSALVPSLASLRRRYRRLPLAGPAAAWLLFAGCSDLFQPLSLAPARVAVSLSVASTGGAHDLGPAYNRVNRVRIRLTPEKARETEAVLDFPPPGGEVRIRVKLTQPQESAQLTVELLRDNALLFRDSTSVLLKVGEARQAQLDLKGVPARVGVQQPVLENHSLGDTVQLSGSVLFATGDTISGLAIKWESLDPEVVEVSSTGAMVSRREGEARVEGRYQELADTVLVRVRAMVASVQVEPNTATLQVRQTLQLSAVLRDARGNALSPRDPQGNLIDVRAVSWISSQPNVAQVDRQSGLVSAFAPGTVTITAATSENKSGSARMEIIPLPPVVTNCGVSQISTTGAVLACTVNPNQSPTSVWFEWETLTTQDGPCSDCATTPRSVSGSAPQAVRETLTNLAPSTQYRWRAVASNAGGTTTGQIQSFATAPLPTFTLTVLGGTSIGAGTVTGPGGINCTIASGNRSGTCQASYTSGTQVTLRATPLPGYAFSGWSGACTGTGTCSPIMNANRSVTASFVLFIR